MHDIDSAIDSSLSPDDDKKVMEMDRAGEGGGEEEGEEGGEQAPDTKGKSAATGHEVEGNDENPAAAEADAASSSMESDEGYDPVRTEGDGSTLRCWCCRSSGREVSPLWQL